MGARGRGGRGAALILALALVGCTAAGGADLTPAAGVAPLPPLAQTWPTRLPTVTAAADAPTDSADTGASAVWPTPPPAAPAAGAPDWTFAVVGDTWKDTPMLRHILRDTVAGGDALLINLGDMTPQGRPEQMTAFAGLSAAAGLPVYVVPGNHDVAWSKTTAPFERYWPRHQSFDRGVVHFTLVDDSAVTLPRAELAWLQADLTATTQPLKLVFMHVPAFMPYPVPSESALSAGGEEFATLMETYHVSAVYAGHLHAYTRVTRNNIPYIITGGGGEPLHVPSLLGGVYHYLRVAVRGTSVSETLVPLDGVPTPGP